ncbi:MAG TPA: helix-turn-helix transcriptional regulator [Candidatus Limnocylindria bacterium]|nr:helix-turn-helix transcriptional regulator [Candidatus Limnocylindria bacterium]
MAGSWPQMERYKARRALEEIQYEQAERFWAAPKPSLEIFGQRIRHGRQQAGLSQRQLANRSGVSQSTISRLERGRCIGLAFIRLVAICSAMGSDFPFGSCPHEHRCRWPSTPPETAPEADSDT